MHYLALLNSYFFVVLFIFIKMRVSLISRYLMNWSKGVSVVKLGVWFTYSRMGSRSALSITSNPSIWKHILPKYYSG